jgi:uncharacterized membrane protein YgcG
VIEEDQPDDDELAERYREPDPEPDLPEPEVPSAPSVDVPEPDPSTVPEELRRGFWTLVLLVNAAVIAVVVGGLLVAAGVERLAGALLVLLGLLLARRAYDRYRSLDERHRSGALTGGPGSEAGGDDEGDDGGGDDGGTDRGGGADADGRNG